MAYFKKKESRQDSDTDDRDVPFCGRKGHLAAIKKNFQDGRQIGLVSGMPGVGKTRLAKEVAFQMSLDCKNQNVKLKVNTFNVAKFTSTNLILDTICASMLHKEHTTVSSKPEDLTTALQKLNLDEDYYLFICDNADTILEDDCLRTELLDFISQIVEKTPNVLFLVTSRRRFRLAREYRLFFDVELSPLEPDEAKDLLAKIAPDVPLQTHGEEIAKMCGYLPIALVIAGVELQRGEDGYTPEELLELLKKNVLESPLSAESYSRSEQDLTTEFKNIEKLMLEAVNCADEDTHRALMRAVYEAERVINQYVHPAQAVPFFEACLSSAMAWGSPEERAKLLNVVGFAMGNYQGRYEDAYKKYIQALELLEPLGESTALARLYSNIGYVYHTRGQHNKAIRYLEDSLEMWDRLRHAPTRGKAVTLATLGIVHDFVGNHEQARDYHTRCLEMRIEMCGENHPLIGPTQNNLAQSEGTFVNDFQAVFATIAEETGYRWPNLARRLGLREAQIQDVDSRHRGNLKESCMDVLETWQKKEGTNVSVPRLQLALVDASLKAIAEKIEDSGEKIEVVTCKGKLQGIFFDVAEETGTKWKDLARKLDLKEAQIDGIASRHHGDLKESCMDVLETWRLREGRDATVQVLQQALIQAELVGIADMISEI